MEKHAAPSRQIDPIRRVYAPLCATSDFTLKTTTRSILIRRGLRKHFTLTRLIYVHVTLTGNEPYQDRVNKKTSERKIRDNLEVKVNLRLSAEAVRLLSTFSLTFPLAM